MHNIDVVSGLLVKHAFLSPLILVQIQLPHVSKCPQYLRLEECHDTHLGLAAPFSDGSSRMHPATTNKHSWPFGNAQSVFLNLINSKASGLPLSM